MKKFSVCIVLLSALALISGCSTAQAACPGGNCSLGLWSPWGGVWYYQSPCAGGRCAVKKAAEPGGEAPAGDLLPAADAAGGEAPAGDLLPAADAAVAKPADPEPVEEPVLTAQPSLCEIVAQLVNRQRERAGLPALEIDPVLCRDCESHSEWMARGGGFRHGFYAGRECIAMGVRSGELAVSMWLGSDGHRAILLGVGKSIGVGRSGNYWTLRVR